MANITSPTNLTLEDVVKKWSDLGGKIDQYLVQEFDAFEDDVTKHCVALIDKTSASVTAQVNDVTLQEGLKVLFDRAGDIRIDSAIAIPATNDQQVVADLNTQPTVPDTAVNAQAQLADKPAEVIDATPVDEPSLDTTINDGVPVADTTV